MIDKRRFTRTNVMLDSEGNAWLDQQTSGAALDRSKILRALVAALRHSTLDLQRFESDSHLAAVCTVGLRGAAAQFPVYTLPKAATGKCG